MEINNEKFAKIKKYLPKQRGNVEISNQTFINAILYVLENGCKWRALPEKYGKWNTVYRRCRRWAESGVLKKLFEKLQKERILSIKACILSLDSTSIKVHPNGHGVFKKTGKQSIGKSHGGWNTKLHMVSSDDKTAIESHLSPGNCHDSPEGRKIIEKLKYKFENVPIVMDRAYEGNETRKQAKKYNFLLVVSPKSNRNNPWNYDKEIYKKRNFIERLFRRIKEFRRIFTRYDKLDVMFLNYIYFAFIVIWLK